MDAYMGADSSYISVLFVTALILKEPACFMETVLSFISAITACPDTFGIAYVIETPGG